MLFHFITQYFILFNSYIQFWSSFFWLLFFIPFLIYLCFSILSLNILFDLIFIFKFGPYFFIAIIFITSLIYLYFSILSLKILFN